MKNPITYIRRSLSTKLSIWIVSFATLIFIISLGFMFSQSLKVVRQEAINRATQILDNTVLRVDNILDRVEIAADNTEWLIMRHLDTPDSMFTYSRQILQNNPDLNGCSIAFEPYYFKDKGKGRYFSAFSYNDNGHIVTTQEGNDHYVYFYMDWYQMVKLLDRPDWTEPFFDYNPEDIYSKDMIASYCKPIKDQQGNYIGTLSVDISLKWLSETISAVKPYPHSYSIMTGVGGTYFVHPDSTKLFYQSIFTETLAQPDTAITALGSAMQRGEEGMQQLTIDGQDCYVFYKPIGQTGWSVAIVCTSDDIFGGYHRLQIIVVSIVVIGLLLMLLIFSRIVGKELQPLKSLADQTEIIAKGNFDQTLPNEDRTDEIGQLSHSFGDMQHSLVNYIEELKHTTAQKASIESELHVATDIQMNMLPRIFPPFPERKDIDLYASMTPAKEVGGDLYNYILRDGCLYFAVGDVSGKGVPAALFMAQATRLFRTLANEGCSPAEIATRMNRELCDGNDTMMFVTMFIGIIHLDTGAMEFCNCGHNPPVLDGQFIPIHYNNRPLGIFEDSGMPFQSEKITDIRGKQLLTYTDGLTEAENSAHEQFGEERVLERMKDEKERMKDARQVVETLLDAVEQHRNGAEPNDDLTLLCLKISKK